MECLNETQIQDPEDKKGWVSIYITELTVPGQQELLEVMKSKLSSQYIYISYIYIITNTVYNYIYIV